MRVLIILLGCVACLLSEAKKPHIAVDRQVGVKGGMTFVEELDSLSMRMFSVFKVKSFARSAGRSARVVTAIVLSFIIVFLVFFLAVQLQRAVVIGAYEEAENQQPVLYRDSYAFFPDGAKAS